MLITNLISRYMKLCKVAFSARDGAKLTKSIQTSDMEMLFLLMVIPRRCKFTQMGRYGKRGEQCYRQKAGKHTPYVGTFWSGCAGAVKHGIEILGIGVIDVDLHECMMLKTVHTTLGKVEEKNEMNLFDRYARVLEDASGKAYALKAWCKELDTSIDRLKAQMVNAYYAQGIIDVLEKNPNTPLNKESANEIFSFAADAA